MPTSHYNRIPAVMNILNEVQPSSVLDVGVGFGKYGVLFREWLDIRKNRVYDPSGWRARIDGVEIWSVYASALYEYVYDKVYFGCITSVCDELPRYDLILMLEVIEHIDKDVGLHVLSKLLKEHCNYAIVLSFPPLLGSEGKHWSNPHETHKCVYALEDFDVFPNKKIVNSGVVYLYGDHHV